MNCIAEIAQRDGRKYITSEDVEDALRDHNPATVRLDLLEILGKQPTFGIVFGVEDYSLCAFVAWSGTVDDDDIVDD